MQSDMNFLRSSPFIPFDFVLHAPILLSYVFFSALRQSFMNVLRSSPFLSAGFVFHVFIRSCCAFSANAGVATAANTPTMANANSRFMGEPRFVNCGFGRIAGGAGGAFAGPAVDVNSVYGNRNGQGNEIADTTFGRVAPVPSCSATWVWNARAVTGAQGA